MANGFDEHLSHLRRKASSSTRLLIDLIGAEVIPLLLQGGFSPSPEAVGFVTNKFGLVWGVNDLAFQDRSIASWPTIVVQINRSLEPYFKIEFCEIPRIPIMLNDTHLPRSEANAAHSVRMFVLRKGQSGSYADQHFGAPALAFWKERRIKRDVALCLAFLKQAIAVDRSRFAASIERSFDPKFLYKCWDISEGLRPNKSAD